MNTQQHGTSKPNTKSRNGDQQWRDKEAKHQPAANYFENVNTTNLP